MQNKYIKILLIILVIAFIVPQITLAVWWNPVSWGLWGKIWGLFHKTENVQQQMVGNDKDEHGCIGSAGYTWCEVKNKCLRTWEEKCEVDPTAGWKTYIDKYGISFRYPNDWSYKEISSNLDLVAFCPISQKDCTVLTSNETASVIFYPYQTNVTKMSLEERAKVAQPELRLINIAYKSIYELMLTTFLVINDQEEVDQYFKRGNDAKIKAILSVIRTQGELYYNDNSTYKGFCESVKIKSLISEIEKVAQDSNFLCYDLYNGWAASAKMNAVNGYYCVGATGYSKTVSGKLATNVCPVN